MKTNIHSKGYNLSDGQQEHFQKKLQKLDRFFEDDIEAAVRIRNERELHIVEITIPLRGGVILRAQDGTDDLYASLDSVMEKLQRQIRKQRTKLERRVRQGAYAKAEMEGALAPAPVEEHTPNIARTKRFTVQPMEPGDAISRMELLGHTFFLFLNEKTNSVCAVYRREDGQYGLLIPEMD